MSLDAEPAYVWPGKHPDATLDYAVDFERECSRQWQKWTDFTEGTRIRVYFPNHASGYEYEVTTAGRSGGRPPQFVAVADATTRDGSVVWAARAISAASLLRTISGTPTWSVDDLTVSNPAVSGTIASADISGGTDGEDYSVTVTAVGSDGVEMVKTIILPVRIPTR